MKTIKSILIMSLLNLKTLVLTAGEVPTSIVPAKRALTLWAKGIAEIRKTYEGTNVRASNFITTDLILKKSKNELISIAVPSVIQCIGSSYEPTIYTKDLPFSRKNIYIRDGGRCQYCNRKVGISSFTFDHVVPQCEGGLTSWENVVVSCKRCNSRKGHKSTKEYFRKLIRRPYAPKLDFSAPKHIVGRLAATIPHETWIDFIYWNIVLEN